MKTIRYRGLEQTSNPRQEVAYQQYGNIIVFSGLHGGQSGARGSTINFAEEIVITIAAHEQLDPRRITFYDLLTQQGCGLDSDYKPGCYRFWQLRIHWTGSGGLLVYKWGPDHPSPEILTDFSKLIWGDHALGDARNMDVAYGVLGARRTGTVATK